jgi:hypothetical protein
MLYIAGNTSSSKLLSNVQEEGYRATVPVEVFQGFVVKSDLLLAKETLGSK